MNTLTYAHPDRSHWLGATDLVVLAGLSRWQKSSVSVWEEKVAGLNGKAPPTPPEPDEGPVLLELGKYVEPFIAQRYQALSATQTIAVRSAPLVHPEVNYWACSPDFLVRGVITNIFDGGEVPPYTHGLETKLVLFGSHKEEELETWGEEGTDQVPQDYLVQCQWSLAVTGLPRWDLAALWYGTEIKRYTILPQPELIARLKEIADDFWTNHVLTERPPGPDGTRDYSRYLARDISRRAYSMRFDLDNDPAYQDTRLFMDDRDLALELGAAAANLRVALQRKEAAVQQFALRFGTEAKVRCGAQEYAIRAQSKRTTDWKSVCQEVAPLVHPAIVERFTHESVPFLVTTIRPSPKPNKE